jgi:hypothetical protein
MKEIFKGAATRASCGVGPLRDFYVALLDKGMKPEMARLTLARKIAAIALTLWKKEERFDAEQLKTQAARALHRTLRGSQVFMPEWWPHRFYDARVPGRVSKRSLGAVCCHAAPSLRVNPMPPGITKKSHRPRASHRMMVGT